MKTTFYGIETYLTEYYYGEYQGEKTYQLGIYNPEFKKFVTGYDVNELAKNLRKNKTALPKGIRIRKGEISFDSKYRTNNVAESGDFQFFFFAVEVNNLEELEKKLEKDDYKSITGYQFLKGTGFKNSDIMWDEVVRRGKANGTDPEKLLSFINTTK